MSSNTHPAPPSPFRRPRRFAPLHTPLCLLRPPIAQRPGSSQPPILGFESFQVLPRSPATPSPRLAMFGPFRGFPSPSAVSRHRDPCLLAVFSSPSAVSPPWMMAGRARPQGFPRPTSPLFEPASPLSQTRSSPGLRSPPRCSPVSLLAGEGLCSEHRDNRASPGILLLVTAPLTRTARVALTRWTTHTQTFLPSACLLVRPSIRCLFDRRHLSHGLVNRAIADLHGDLYVKDRTGKTRLVLSV